MKMESEAMSPQLLHMLRSLYQEVHIINLETHSAYCLLPDGKGVMMESSFIPVWEAYVKSRDELLYENHKVAVRQLLSCESLKAEFNRGKHHLSCAYPSREGEDHRISFKITMSYHFFYEKYPNVLCARVIVKKEDASDFLRHVVMQQVCNESGGYYCIDAVNDQFTPLRGAESQVALLSRHYAGYTDVLRSYIESYVVPEERDRVWHEANIKTVLSRLEEKAYHSFYCDVILDDGTPASREWQFSYYDKMTKRILLHRTNVSDLYLSKRQLTAELAEARQAAETDPLTGILNYRGIVTKVKELLMKDASHAALLFLDLDNFKQVNDVFGHPTGDSVLKQVAAAFGRMNWIGEQYVGRVGGDEFVVFLPHMESEFSVARYAEALCKEISTIIAGSSRIFTVSGSVGVSFSSRDGKTYEDLLQIADERAYKAKSQGKNRFIMT